MVYIATIDEEFDVREKQYILNIADMFGLNKEQSEELIVAIVDRKENVEDILSGITERKTKLLLIYDLITLSYADENYCDREKAGIINIGKILNIESGKISEIELYYAS
ncbi:TerB family tellurite resistance protein [Clostridium sp.]|uniref:TerB family tellurite resistance protein n=1 Tax=Clostridium sp. TaxID=1506 RepID=UPI003D6CB46D